jgi:beta-lactamase superfamily II metal-dependent hydrolase
MPKSARLEIHQINVGRGDSILIINRDLDKVKKAISKKNAPAANTLDPIHYVPYAVAKSIDLEGTVNKALLVDGGDDEYGGDVLAYLEKQGVFETNPKPYCPNLSILVSHYHDDHMAGLRHIFKERVEPPKPKKGEKPGKVTYKERYRPAVVYQTALDKKNDPPPKSKGGQKSRFKMFEEDVDAAHKALSNKTVRQFINPGGVIDPAVKNKTVTTIELGTGVGTIPIKLYVIAAAQQVFNEPTDRCISIASVSKKKADQNDRSIVMILEYGSFRYFLGGDIAGSGLAAGGNVDTEGIVRAFKPKKKKNFSSHADVESTLGPALEGFLPKTKKREAGKPKYTTNGYCTVMKANHHSSNSSVDVFLLSAIRPSLAVISTGMKTHFHQHPTQEVINRMNSTATPKWGKRPSVIPTIDNTIQQVYITEVCDKHKNKKFTVDLRGARILGDVVIRPVDETVKAVQDATGKGKALLEVQVYGSGEQSGFSDKGKTVRATEKKNVPVPNTPLDTKNYYPIGPYYHTDTH